MTDLIVPQTGDTFLPAPTRKITQRDESIEHLITDSELTELQSVKQDNVTQIFWGSLGAALGAAAPAIQEMQTLGTASFNVWSLVECIVFFVGLFVAAVMAVFWCRRHKRSSDLSSTIRSRHKDANY